MANLPEMSTFEDAVYQLELVDYIEGGVRGVHNIPLRQITNRTRWLFDRANIAYNTYRYTLPMASATTLGGVKIGEGLLVESDGTVSLIMPTTTTAAPTTTTAAPVTIAPTTTTTAAPTTTTTTATPITLPPTTTTTAAPTTTTTTTAPTTTAAPIGFTVGVAYGGGMYVTNSTIAYDGVDSTALFSVDGVVLTTNSISENIGLAYNSMSSISNNAMSYGGQIYSTNPGYYGAHSNKSIVFNKTGVVVTKNTSTSTTFYRGAGAETDSTAVYFGGSEDGANQVNSVNRFNSQGINLGSVEHLGTARKTHIGGSYSSAALFYAGMVYNNGTYSQNLVTRINKTGTMVGSEISVGTPRYNLAGNTIEGVTIARGGSPTNAGTAARSSNITTKISEDGSIIGTETTIGDSHQNTMAAMPIGNSIKFTGMQPMNSASDTSNYRIYAVDKNGTYTQLSNVLWSPANVPFGYGGAGAK
jgi:hypothetical protein